MTFPIDIEEYTRDKMKLLEDPDMGDYAVFRAMHIPLAWKLAGRRPKYAKNDMYPI